MNEERIQRILLIRLSSIGDIVLTTPLLRQLHQRYPEARIDYLTKARFTDLIRHHPAVSEVIAFPDHGGLADLLALRRELHRRRYDVVLDLHKNFRSYAFTSGMPRRRIHRFKKFSFRRWFLVHTGKNLYREVVPVYRRYLQTAAHLGVKDDGNGTEIFVPSAVQQRMREVLLQHGLPPDEFVALAPGAGFATKRWPLENFVAVAKKLFNQGRVFCILGDEADEPLGRELAAAVPGAVNFTGRLKLLESTAVLQEAALLLCNDSGLMHVAEAVKTPVAVIFGSTVREFGFFPHREESLVIENVEIGCRPCSHVGRRACPKGHFLCMRSLTPEVVWRELENRYFSQRR